MIRWTSSAALLIALAACHAKKPGPTPQQLAATAAAEASDTVGCDMLGSLTDYGPDSLVAEFIARDGQGAFTQSDPWLDTALACPGQVPGWDGFTLVAGSSTRIISRAFDSIAVEVTYARRGFLDQDSTGFIVREAPAAEVDTFVAVQTPFGWRISAPVQEPHLLKAAALKLNLNPDYRVMVQRVH